MWAAFAVVVASAGLMGIFKSGYTYRNREGRKVASQTAIFLFERLLVARTGKCVYRISTKFTATTTDRPLVQPQITFYLPICCHTFICDTNGLTLEIRIETLPAFL